MWSTEKKNLINPAAPQALGDEPKLNLAQLQEGMSGKLKGYCRRLSAAGNDQAQNGPQVQEPCLAAVSASARVSMHAGAGAAAEGRKG